MGPLVPCSLRLVVDPRCGSPVAGRGFDVLLPPPSLGHADFVVPRGRFEAAVRRMWQPGDTCQVRGEVARVG